VAIAAALSNSWVDVVLSGAVKRPAFADPKPQLLSIARDGGLTAVGKPVVDFRASRSTCE
jgi:hypothetical protein